MGWVPEESKDTAYRWIDVIDSRTWFSEGLIDSLLCINHADFTAADDLNYSTIVDIDEVFSVTGGWDIVVAVPITDEYDREEIPDFEKAIKLE